MSSRGVSGGGRWGWAGSGKSPHTPLNTYWTNPSFPRLLNIICLSTYPSRTLWLWWPHTRSPRESVEGPINLCGTKRPGLPTHCDASSPVMWWWVTQPTDSIWPPHSHFFHHSIPSLSYIAPPPFLPSILPHTSLPFSLSPASSTIIQVHSHVHCSAPPFSPSLPRLLPSTQCPTQQRKHKHPQARSRFSLGIISQALVYLHVWSWLHSLTAHLLYWLKIAAVTVILHGSQSVVGRATLGST